MYNYLELWKFEMIYYSFGKNGNFCGNTISAHIKTAYQITVNLNVFMFKFKNTKIIFFFEFQILI